ncbi:MAG: acyl carrier protein [Saccharofermentanales bacterium]|nr:acyl carrier protein [Clostridiaceae bacterium]
MSNLSRDQIYDDVIRTIAEVTEYDPAELNGQTELIADLGLDSLMIFEIVIELEEKFDLRISDEEADQIKTIDQAVDFVVRELAVGK